MLAGKNIVLTGAASGIGQATAVELARRGARLLLVDVDRAGVEETAASIGAASFAADLTAPEAISGITACAMKELGSVDMLINNAGVAVVGPLLETREPDWDWIFAVNVHAPIKLTRALLPQMIERRSGQIVFTSSLAGLVGAPGMIAYSTTKFALVGFAESLRLETAAANIGVTVVCPGYVRTGLHRATRYSNPGFQRFLDDPPFWYGVSKERAAQKIVRAIDDRSPLLVFGLEKVGWWLKRVSPAASFQVSRWIGRRTGIFSS